MVFAAACFIHFICANNNDRVIITSGFSATHRVKKAKDMGAGAYIRKPYTLEKIGMAVKKELNR